jgi:RNA polymerase sigma-70 factor (ECF subfamily)
VISDEDHDDGLKRSAFPETQWSLVLRIQGNDQDKVRDAMQDLCNRYWYPVYSFARRRLTPEDAEDATQSFFARLISSDSMLRADQDKGRLRSFLMGGMKNFLAQQWRDGNTLKRGREVTIVPVDGAWEEERLQFEAANGAVNGDDDTSFDQAWAIALIDRAIRRLESFYVERGRKAVFEALKPCLVGDGSYATDPKLAELLGLTGEGVRSAVYQMRRRFRRYVEEEVAETVASEGDIRDELALLCRILANQ